jgi:hypothetical protein
MFGALSSRWAISTAGAGGPDRKLTGALRFTAQLVIDDCGRRPVRHDDRHVDQELVALAEARQAPVTGMRGERCDFVGAPDS